MKIYFFFQLFLMFFFNANLFGQPKVILKFDDLMAYNGTFTGKPIMDYLIQKEVKFSYGVIANSLDDTAYKTLIPYINAKDKNGDTLLEIWNHGLEHTCNEFLGTNYEYQKFHIDIATQRVKNFLGIQMHTFGSPCNANDSITNQVLSNDTNYKVFFQNNFEDTSSKNLLFLKWPDVQVEKVLGDPNYSFFVNNYNSIIRYNTKYMILTCHPNNWTPAQLEQFRSVIDFLIERKHEFVLPFDYYNSFNLLAPTDLVAKVLTPYKVNLSWTDNSTSEYNYKIERSSDGINWITIGTCPENSTNYLDDNIYSVSGFYDYRVYANCGIKSELSNISSVTNLNTKPIEYNLNISVFPNPSVDKTVIKWSQAKAGVVSCYIYDINGSRKKTVFQGQYSSGEYQFSLDVSDLKSGVYFCCLYTQFGNLKTKILVLEN